jgi:signal transduction histidine kinase
MMLGELAARLERAPRPDGIHPRPAAGDAGPRPARPAPLDQHGRHGAGTDGWRQQQATLGKRIQSSSNRMQRMIGQVLDMSRIDRGLAWA